MKFSFNEFHLWHQLGLSLMASGKVSSFLLKYHQDPAHNTPKGDIRVTAVPLSRPPWHLFVTSHPDIRTCGVSLGEDHMSCSSKKILFYNKNQSITLDRMQI